MVKRTTIKDLAEYTGFSIATISLVLNNNAPSIPDTAKEKIFQAAKELNYIPNFAARSLVKGQTKTIGVIIPDLSNSFFSSLVYKIQVELNKYNYDIILCNSNEKLENDIHYIQLLSSRGVDAILIALSAESLKEENKRVIKQTLNSLFVPFIFLDRDFDIKASKVLIDNNNAGYQVADALYQNGHQKIGFITGPLNLNSSFERLNGALKYLKEHQIKVDESYIYEGKYDFDSGYYGAEAILSKNHVTAIFAFNDLQAYGVYDYAQKKGIRIPEDLSIVGFDNLETSKIITPKLSTVEQPIEELSSKVCESLLKIIDDHNLIMDYKLPTKLVLRDSMRKL